MSSPSKTIAPIGSRSASEGLVVRNRAAPTDSSLVSFGASLGGVGVRAPWPRELDEVP